MSRTLARAMSDETLHFDVLIVGAGLSGIGAAVHLQQRCPDRTYAVLEGRERLTPFSVHDNKFNFSF